MNILEWFAYTYPEHGLNMQPANYPVPVTNIVSDIAINYLAISHCQCEVCAENYIDGLTNWFS